MRAVLSVLLGLMLVAPVAQAGTPLPPGKVAGTKQAILGTSGTIILVTLGVIVVVGALGVAMGNAQSSSSTSH